MRIIIDWEEREIYKEENFFELLGSMIEYDMIDNFESYLSNNYCIEDVFDFTAAEKAEIIAEYKKYQINKAEQIIKSHGNYAIIEINPENKVNIKN